MPEKSRSRKRTKPAVVKPRKMTAPEVDIQRRARERVMVRIAVAVLLFVLVLLAIAALTHHGR